MRIAVVTCSFLPNVGGGEMVTHWLANQWVAQGHEVCVFNATTHRPVHPEARYQVQRFWVPRGATRFGYHRFPWQALTVASLRRKLRAFSADFLSGQFAYPTGVWLGRLRTRIPCVITCHGADILRNQPGSDRDRYKIDTVLRKSLSRAHAVVAISLSARQALVELGVPSTRIVDVPNGVDVHRFRRPVGTDLRRQLGWPPTAQVVLTVGRNDPQKNLPLAVRVVSAAMEQVPRLYYLMIGRGVSTLAAQWEALRLRDRVHLQEELMGEPLVGAYQQADVFLSTSHWELCPLVLLEAMAAGLPQVATDVPGNRDLIEHGHTGLLVNPDRSEALTSAIVDLLEDPVRRGRMSVASRIKAEAFAWSRISRRYLELIRDFQPN